MAVPAEPPTLSPDCEAAWLGILRAHGEVTRALDATLGKRHGLTSSAYEVLSQLARAPEGAQRMSDLAGCSPLSLSRVSRVIDTLQGRGLVTRISCDKDSRVVYAAVTAAGRTLAASASRTFGEVVAERYLGRLSCDEVARLGELLSRVAADDGHDG